MAMNNTRATRLWASDIGRCPRSAMLRILGFERTRDFPPIVKKAMQFGCDKEEETLRTLVEAFGTERIASQMRVGNERWSAKTDVIVDHGTEGPIIIEHKAVFGRWRGKDVVRSEDIAQLWLYGHLYEESQSDAFGIKRPALILFYRGRRASFLCQVFPLARGGLDVYGFETLAEPLTGPLVDFINGFTPNDVPIVQIDFGLDVWKLRADLESYYQEGELPPRLPAPEHRKCTWQGEPSCLMFGHCWPDAVML